jgi:pyridoxal phosphate enzyme (YggS family)
LSSVKENYAFILDRIAAACARAGRSPEEVNVIAVTKYVSPERIREALDAGILHIGESKAQTGVPKWEQLGERGTWHFIGHLQTNKVKQILGKFTYVHSLDRLSLANELEKRGEQAGVVTRCLVQVNISGEESKQGLNPEEVLPFLKEIESYQHIEVVGLMTMAPYVEDPEETRWIFRTLREMRDQLQQEKLANAPLQHLSMGMSNDFEVAVEEGATFVRIGTALVGNEMD